MLTAIRYVLFIPTAFTLGIFIPDLFLTINLFIENLFPSWEGDIFFFLDAKVAFLYFMSFSAGGFGGAGIIFGGLYVAPKESKITVGCLITLSMLINSAEILSLLTLDAEAVLKGAAFLVPIGSLLITIMCGYESFVRNKKLIKTTLRP